MQVNSNEKFDKIDKQNKVVPDEKAHQTRRKIIEELIITEQKYIRDLKVIIELVIPKIKENFSQDQTQKMFINLPRLVQANQQFLEKLLDQVQKDKVQFQKQQNSEFQENINQYSNNFFQLFQQINIVSIFKCYIEFSRRYQEAQIFRAQQKGNQVYLDAIKEAVEQINLTQNQSLTSNQEFQYKYEENNSVMQSSNFIESEDFVSIEILILQPTQRLAKLELYFEELVKSSQGYPDFKNITQLLKQFHIINKRIDREFQKYQEWTKIQNQFTKDEKKQIEKDATFNFLEMNLEYKMEVSQPWECCSLICLSNKIIIYRTSDQKILFANFTQTTEIFYDLGNVNIDGFSINITLKTFYYFRSTLKKNEMKETADELLNVVNRFQGKIDDSPDKNSDEKENKKKIDFVRKKKIEELIITEQNYIKDLNLIIKFVIPKIEKHFSSDQAQKLFLNFPELIQANQQFCNKLLSQVQKDNLQYNNEKDLQFQDSVIEYSRNFFQTFQSCNIVSLFECYKNFNTKYQEAEKLRAEYLSNQIYEDSIKEAVVQSHLAKYQSYISKLGENNKINQQIVTLYQENNGQIPPEEIINFQKNYQKFQDIIKEAHKLKELKIFEDAASLENQIFKAAQRLPRLELFFKDIETLSRDYPDYMYISDLLNQFEKINKDINTEIYKKTAWEKILQKFTEDENKNIQKDTTYVTTEMDIEYKMSQNDSWRSCSLIYLSDQIIIYRPNDKKKYFVNFTFTTEIIYYHKMEIENQGTFEILNKGKIWYFRASAFSINKITERIEEQITTFKTKLNKILNSDQYQQWNANDIKVTVIGTEEYDVATTNNYTVFIIKLELHGGEIDWKIYKRFSELVNIQKYIQKKDGQSGILPLKQGSWFSLHDNEQLKCFFSDIENFIISIFKWKMFNTAEIKRTILRSLGIPNNFISLPLIFGRHVLQDRQRQSMIQIQKNEKEIILQQSNSLNQRFLEELKKTKMIGESIRKKKTSNLQGNEQIGYDEDINNYEKEKEKEIEVQIPYSLYKLYEENQFIQPKIETVLDSLPIKIKVDYLTKVIEMCEKVAKFIRLKEFHDFRLVLIDSRGNKRVLDNDQIVLQSLPKKFISKNDKMSMPKKIWNKIQIEQITYKLYFQKYIFFTPEIETLLFEGDRIRLIMINDHFFRELKFNSFTLDQFVLIYALFIIIFQKYESVNRNKFLFETEELDQLITQKIRKTQPDEFWKEQPQVGYLYNKLREIAINQHPDFEYLENEISYLARKALAKFSYSKQIFEQFGTIQFYVGINIKENNELFQNKLNLLPNVYLGITNDAVKLFNPSNKIKLEEFKLSNIHSAQAEPAYLILQMNQSQEVNLLNEGKTKQDAQKINKQVSTNERQQNNNTDKNSIEIAEIKQPLLEKNENDKNENDKNEKNDKNDDQKNAENDISQINSIIYKFKTAEAYRISQLIKQYKSHQEV